MSFSFRKLFKKSEQDSEVERTRLQFVRPQDQHLSSDEVHRPPANDSGNPRDETLPESPFSRLGSQSPDQNESSGGSLISPFEIVDPVPENLESDDSSQWHDGKSPGKLPPVVDGVHGEEDGGVLGTSGRLFDEAPKLANESLAAGFGETVMETGVENIDKGKKPDAVDSSLPGYTSFIPDNVIKEDPQLTKSSVSEGLDNVSSLNDLSWVNDPDQIEDEPPSLTSVHGDLPDHDERISSNKVDDLAAESGRLSGGSMPFAYAEPLNDVPEIGDGGKPISSSDQNVRPQEKQPYSSSIPTGPLQPAGVPASTKDDDRSDFLPKDFLGVPDKGYATGDADDHLSKAPPLFEDALSQNEGISSGFVDESQVASEDSYPPKLPDFPFDSGKGNAMDSTGFEDIKASDTLQAPLSVSDPNSLLMEGGGDLLKAHLMKAEPLESLSPLAADFSGASDFSRRPTPDPEADVSGIPLESTSSRIADQSTLRALLMTDLPIDGQMVVGHCSSLDGIYQCVAYTADGRIKASSISGESSEFDFISLIGSVKTLTEVFETGLEGPLTFSSAKGLVSFFASSDACLGILHSEGALKSGIQERLRLIASVLNAECN